YVFRFWPVILIAVGLFKLVESGDNYAHSSGIFWVVVGGIFFLGSIGILRVAFYDFWPVVLIGLGALMLLRTTLAQRNPRAFTSDPDRVVGASEPRSGDAQSQPNEPVTSSDQVVSAMAILGSVVRRNNCSDFRGGSATAVMGRCEIDLRGASISSAQEPQ